MEDGFVDNINSQYKGSEEQVADVLSSEGFVLLGNILEGGVHDGLTLELTNAQFTEDTVPDMHSFSVSDVSEDCKAVLDSVRMYLEEVLKRDLHVTWSAVRQYGRGSFTLQHDEQPPSGVFVTLFFCGDWPSDFRGELTLVPENGEPLKVFPQDNSLLVVKRHETTNVFVKKVTYKAQIENYVALHAVFD